MNNEAWIKQAAQQLAEMEITAKRKSAILQKAASLAPTKVAVDLVPKNFTEKVIPDWFKQVQNQPLDAAGSALSGAVAYPLLSGLGGAALGGLGGGAKALYDRMTGEDPTADVLGSAGYGALLGGGLGGGASLFANSVGSITGLDGTKTDSNAPPPNTRPPVGTQLVGNAFIWPYRGLQSMLGVPDDKLTSYYPTQGPQYGEHDGTFTTLGAVLGGYRGLRHESQTRQRVLHEIMRGQRGEGLMDTSNPLTADNAKEINKRLLELRRAVDQPLPKDSPSALPREAVKQVEATLKNVDKATRGSIFDIFKKDRQIEIPGVPNPAAEAAHAQQQQLYNAFKEVEHAHAQNRAKFETDTQNFDRISKARGSAPHIPLPPVPVDPGTLEAALTAAAKNNKALRELMITDPRFETLPRQNPGDYEAAKVLTVGRSDLRSHATNRLDTPNAAGKKPVFSRPVGYGLKGTVGAGVGALAGSVLDYALLPWLYRDAAKSTQKP